MVRSILFLAFVFSAARGSGSLFAAPAQENVDRLAKIPAAAVKMSPATDEHPPVLLSDEFEDPLPVPGAVNTAGAEDSPFILPDGGTLFFFLHARRDRPGGKTAAGRGDRVYVSRKTGGVWGAAQRVRLQDPGKQSMDGCEFVQGDVMWFCSARTGYDGLHWFTAENRDGIWRNWRLADFPSGYEVGELHISADGMELYFGSARPGGKGKLDLWASEKVGEKWREPVTLALLNTPDDEGWPALNPDGMELWFYRNFGLWRSKRTNGDWGAAQQVVSTLAGEPAFDRDGNVYFVHHYYAGDRMIEADIYVAYRK